jgi:radical SAM protein with 4Fe4S-binding SPASM domain
MEARGIIQKGEGRVDHQRTKTQSYAYHLDIIGRSKIPQDIIRPEFREYRRKWEELPEKQIVSDFPLHLNIEATGRCNLMCTHCFRHSRRTEIGDMEFDLFKRIIDEGKEYNLPSIEPTLMGESFEHPQLIDMIKYAKSQGVLDIKLNTNGTLVNESIQERVLDSGLDTIVFSIDAVTEESYNRIKFGSDFRLVNKNVEDFINLKYLRGLKKPKIIVQMIDQKQTHDELMSFVRYWQNKADIVRIAIYQSPDGNPNDKNRTQNSPETIFPCPQLWQRLAIAWDGTVYPCVGDNACREPLGNVNNTRIYNIWHGERLNYLREKHSKYEADDIDLCLHCDLNKIPKIINNYKKM